MKLILLEDVKEVGKKGDLISAADGYARNYLLPRKLAKKADTQAMNELRNAEKAKQYKADSEITQAQRAKDILEGGNFKVSAKAGKNGKLFGSVTAKEISVEIKNQLGVDIDKRKIVIVSDIKTVGTYPAQVKLHSGITANVNILVEAES